MKKQSVWLSYDLGVDGDYEALYYWLDAHEGRECGDSMAYVVYGYKDDNFEMA